MIASPVTLTSHVTPAGLVLFPHDLSDRVLYMCPDTMVCYHDCILLRHLKVRASTKSTGEISPAGTSAIQKAQEGKES
ncbi:MAG: hypothetical protein NTV68_04680 [Methanomicrobiales archaeon]|nr:hypothetical protein [Methanomicrobiales archaeon]